jgi:membrane protease YdiL (CAAX protease family)
MENKMGRDNRFQYVGIIVIFFVVAGLIGASTYVRFIPSDTRLALKIGMLVFTLAASILLSWRESLRQYRGIAVGLFAVSLGVLLTHYIGNYPLKLLGFSVTTVQGVAMAKFGEALPIVLSILVVHFATGGSRDGLFLQKGNLRFGMTAGLIGFAVFAGIGSLQAMGSSLTLRRVTIALPWILIFIFSNALMEELWFRGLFLKKLEPLIGRKTTLVLTSLVFAMVHISATYVIDIILFQVVVLGLGFLWGWLMQRTDSIWGSVLIHAGGDILAILGFLAGANL